MSQGRINPHLIDSGQEREGDIGLFEGYNSTIITLRPAPLWPSGTMASVLEASTHASWNRHPWEAETGRLSGGQHAGALWVLSWPLMPPPPRWMNACCWDVWMFQVVMPAGKRDCELSRAMQICVRRCFGPSRGHIPPGAQPGGQSWGVREILRNPHASQLGTRCRC